MATNKFENSRVSEGTLRTGAQHDGTGLKESSAISRDDVRDGFAEPPVSNEGNSTAMEVSNMIAEGGPVSLDRDIATARRLRMLGVVARARSWASRFKHTWANGNLSSVWASRHWKERRTSIRTTGRT